MAAFGDDEVFASGFRYSDFHMGKANIVPLSGIKTRISGSDLLGRHRRQSSLDISPTTACPSYSAFRIPAFRSRSRSSSVCSSTAGEASPLTWFKPSHRASYACRFHSHGAPLFILSVSALECQSLKLFFFKP